MATRRKVSTRNKRIPVGGNRNILTVEGKDKGYIYRWVNDTDNRITEFRSAGYENVQEEGLDIGSVDVKQGTNIGKTVSKNVGQDTTAYLMRIPQEYYKEDQQAKADKTSKSEDIIYENVKNLSGRHGKIEIK